MKGFTLIETLLATAIIMILMAIVLPNYRFTSKVFSLEQSTIRLSQDARRAEELAMSAKEFQGSVPRGGYGLYLESGAASYILFADCNEDSRYTSGDVCGNAPNLYGEKIEEIQLDLTVKIADEGLSPSSPLHVVFVPPWPTVNFSGAGLNATITLVLREDLSRSKTVQVNKAGLIEIQ